MPTSRSPEPTDLLGTWILDRIIDDRAAAERLTVTGASELTTADGRVRWHESGTLHRPGSDIPVSRTLYVEQRADSWFVTFDDGRDFHPWAPGREVVHPCAPDTYAGHIDVVDDDRWTVVWTVSGPAKDYTMTSTMTRADQPNEKA